MRGGLHLGTVRGIELRINWSVAVIMWLVAWSLAAEALPALVEGRTDGEYWTAGIVTTVAFFAGLVAHELGHSLVALRRGVEVRSITLWLFGGVAELGSSPRRADDAFRIAIAGPLVSLALGAAGLAASWPAPGLAGAALLWFGSMNLVLALFNLLPAFPLDGGRVYQAWLWGRGRGELEATTRAAGLGHVIGGVLVALGLVEALLGGLVGGIWLMAIGWFLREASLAEAAHARVEGPLRSLTVAEVMTPAPLTVRAATPLEEFVAGVFFGGRHAAYPVVDDAGAPRGLLTVATMRVIPRDEWPQRTVGSVATPLAEVVVVTSHDALGALMGALAGRGDGRALVIDEGRLVGIVAPSDIARLVGLIELTAPPGARVAEPLGTVEPVPVGAPRGGGG